MIEPFFIVGCERSGTTLLATILDRHSEVALPPETHFFEHVMPASGIAGDHAAMVEQMAHSSRVRDCELSPGALLERFKSVQPTWPNLLTASLELYAAQRGKSRYGEKTPAHLQYVPQIMSLYRKSKVVCIVRDARDVVQSLMNMPWALHRKTRFHAETWREAALRALAYRQQYADRFHIVQFEDLLREPEKTVGRVDEFLGLTFEPRQLDAHVGTNVVPDWEKPWKGKAAAELDPSRIGAWKKTLSRQQQWTIDMTAGRELQAFGYEASLASCPIWRRGYEQMMTGVSRSGWRRVYVAAARHRKFRKK